MGIGKHLGGIFLKKIVITLLTFVLAIIPITAFADTTSTSVSKQTPSTQIMVQLKDLPVMIDGVKYAQDDSHVKNVTQFVFDDAAKAEGVVYGFTNQDRLNAHLQSAVVERKRILRTIRLQPKLFIINRIFINILITEGVTLELPVILTMSDQLGTTKSLR